MKLKTITTKHERHMAVEEPKVELISHYVINRSEVHLIHKQLLYKGLNYDIKEPTFPKKDIIMDVDSTKRKATEKKKSTNSKKSLRD